MSSATFPLPARYDHVGSFLRPKYLLDARERPYITEFEKTYHYPKYSLLPDKTVAEQDGSLVALDIAKSPFTIMAIDNRMIEDLQLVTFDDVARYTTINSTAGQNETANARGFGPGVAVSRRVGQGRCPRHVARIRLRWLCASHVVSAQ